MAKSFTKTIGLMEPFEIETGPGEPTYACASTCKTYMSTPKHLASTSKTFMSSKTLASVAASGSRALFPLEICCCLPQCATRYAPKTWTIIQNWTHFGLLAGIVAVAFILGIHINAVVTNKRCRSRVCLEEVLVLVFLVPSAFYMNKMLERYDEQVQAKRKAVAERKAELAMNVDALITSMDTILRKVTESSAMLAEKSIESNRRAFQRFLSYVGQKFAQMPLSKAEAEMVLTEVRRLIKRWLLVFEECSVDPIAHPMKIVSDEEINRCTLIPELAQLVTERLKSCEVRFISHQKEEDTLMIAGLYTGSRRLTSTELPDLEAVQLLAEKHGESAQKKCPKACCPKAPCEWMKIQGCGFHCSRADDASEGACYPMELQFGIIWISIVSRNHFVLVCTFFSVFFLGFLEVMQHMDILYCVALFFYEVCIVLLLVRFEDLDLLRRLEREVQQLTAENERIKTRQNQMCGFWDGVNDLTDLWVHRTVPRLELLKEVQGHVEDAAREGIHVVLPLMQAANNQLENLDRSIGEVNMWRMNSTSNSDRKKRFGETIMCLCRGSTMMSITGGLTGVIQDLQQSQQFRAGADGHPIDIQRRSTPTEEQAAFEQVVSFLEHVPLIMRLPKDLHPIIAARCQQRDFRPGEVIIRQGDVGREFFLIRSGEAKVTMESRSKVKHVATLKSGDYVGETSLINDEPREATVTALSVVSVLVLAQQDFEELGLSHKVQFANRRVVGGGGNRLIRTKPATRKSSEEQLLISEALWSNENLQTMVTLNEERIQQMINIMWKERVQAGKLLMMEGDLNSDYFYIVQTGSFQIYVTIRGMTKDLIVASRGNSFGELALLYLTPRAASVRAITDSEVWVIDRVNFKEVLMKASEEKISEYVQVLDRVEALSGLLADEKKKLANALSELSYIKGDVILQQGEIGSIFYILYDGEVSVSIKGKGQVAKLSAQVGDNKKTSFLRHKKDTGNAVYFGERALQGEEMRSATVVVSSTTARVLAIDSATFDALLGGLGTAMVQHSEEQSNRRITWRSGGASPKKTRDLVPAVNKDAIRFQDLKPVGLLGSGTFGYVELCEHIRTGHTYAMKTLCKGFIMQAGVQDNVLSEKKVLLMANSPFIIKLFETFNGPTTVSFLLEPALGGELLTVYKSKGFYGKEEHAKFYMACVTIAFEHLHFRRIIYRDLKPENLVLNKHGIAKLVDMGLAKFTIGRTYTTCGTPEYFAPEMISSAGHTNAVDWWALGIFVFELMVGHTPFAAMHPMGIYSKVVNGIEKIIFPPRCQGDVKDFIVSLLQQDPSWRLPMKPGGVQNVKAHSWTSSLDWNNIQALMVEPPYKPTVRNKKDLSNIKATKDDVPKPIKYIDDGSGWDEDFATA